jgi:hypothetical protein
VTLASSVLSKLIYISNVVGDLLVARAWLGLPKEASNESVFILEITFNSMSSQFAEKGIREPGEQGEATSTKLWNLFHKSSDEICSLLARIATVAGTRRETQDEAGVEIKSQDFG